MLLCMCLHKHSVEFYVCGALANLRNAIFSFVMSVRPSDWNNSDSNWRIFMTSDTWTFFENLSSKFKSYQNLTRRRITLYEHLMYTYMYDKISITLFRTGNITKLYRKSDPSFYVQWGFFTKFCLLWDNVQKYGRFGQATDANMAQLLFVAWWLCIQIFYIVTEQYICMYQLYFFPISVAARSKA